MLDARLSRAIPPPNFLAGMVPFRSEDPHFRVPGELAMVRNGPAVLALLQLPPGEAPLQGSRAQKGPAGAPGDRPRTACWSGWPGRF